jgi:hypothetical protein
VRRGKEQRAARDLDVAKLTGRCQALGRHVQHLESTNSEGAFVKRLERGIVAIVEWAPNTSKAVDAFLTPMGEVKNVDGAAREVENMEALGVDAAFLLSVVRGLLICESSRAQDARMIAAIKANKSIQLQYGRNEGVLKYEKVPKAKLEEMKAQRDLKRDAQLLTITTILVAARSGGTKILQMGFFLSLTLSFIGGLSNSALGFATFVGVASSHETIRGWVLVMRRRWMATYFINLAARAKVGVLTIFDNWVPLQWAKTPDGSTFTNAVSSISIIAYPIPPEETANLDVSPNRPSAMLCVKDPKLMRNLRAFFNENLDYIRPRGKAMRIEVRGIGSFERAAFPMLAPSGYAARLRDFTVLPSLKAKSSSVADTKNVVLAFINELYDKLPCSGTDQLTLVDGEPFGIIDTLSALDPDLVSHIVALLAVFHLQKHLFENHFCDPVDFWRLWAPICIALDFRSEHMHTTAARLKKTAGGGGGHDKGDDSDVCCVCEASTLTLDGDVMCDVLICEVCEREFHLGCCDGLDAVPEVEFICETCNASVLQTTTVDGRTVDVECDLEALAEARLRMHETEEFAADDAVDVADVTVDDDENDDDGGDDDDGTEAPKTGGVSGAQKAQCKPKYERSLHIASLLLATWKRHDGNVDSSDLRTAVVDVALATYARATKCDIDNATEAAVEWACEQSDDFAYLWNALDNELRIMVEPFIAWCEGDILPIHQHLGVYSALLIYYVNQKTWKQCKVPIWILSYMAQTLYRIEHRKDIPAVQGRIGPWTYDVFIEHTNSCLKRALPTNQRIDFPAILSASADVNLRWSVKAGLDKMTGSGKARTKSELQRVAERANSARFAKARRRLYDHLFDRFQRALLVAEGKGASEGPPPVKKIEKGLAVRESFFRLFEKRAANAQWPKTRKPKATLQERITTARQDTETRDAALAELKKTMTRDKVMASKAIDLLRLAKGCVPPEALRITDPISSKRRYLVKAELQALFLSLFSFDAPNQATRADPEAM